MSQPGRDAALRLTAPDGSRASALPFDRCRRAGVRHPGHSTRRPVPGRTQRPDGHRARVYQTQQFAGKDGADHAGRADESSVRNRHACPAGARRAVTILFAAHKRSAGAADSAQPESARKD